MSGIGGNIRFANPKEPAFLQKIIQETGYKESPTVDTKVCGINFNCERENSETEDLLNYPFLTF